jgi:hypothetical protein
MNKSNTATITATAYGFAVDYSEFEKTVKAGNACLAADVVSDIIGVDLYACLIDYLDAGCELVDIELEDDGVVVINALKNGCNVGEYTIGEPVPEDVNLLDLFNALPNLYN